MERVRNSEDNVQQQSSEDKIKWSDLNFCPELNSLIDKVGYQTPTPVQSQTTPLILAGHDVLVSSQTGSGKTASFVLPIVEKFKGKKGTYILALAPTREIAQQTGAVFETFGRPLGLNTVVCIGGASIPAEKESLATGPQIIVATPGRLCDHLERGNVWLDFIQCLVFDEADRMLEMGFAKQIDMITEQLPKERQTLMFSATYAPSVEKLARKVLRNPKEVKIGVGEGSVPKIDQRLFWMQDREKIFALVDLIKKEKGTIIIFTNAKEKVYRIWRDLHSHKFEDVTYIHSDCTQEHREKAIADFKAGKFRVLIATDVAGRGVDIDDVAHVVNYDIPREAEDYIHRIGRTGRRGKTGIATSFAIPVRDEQGVRAIEKLLGIPSPEITQKSRSGDRPRDSRTTRRPVRESRNSSGRHESKRHDASGEDKKSRPSSDSRRHYNRGQDNYSKEVARHHDKKINTAEDSLQSQKTHHSKSHPTSVSHKEKISKNVKEKKQSKITVKVKRILKKVKKLFTGK